MPIPLLTLAITVPLRAAAAGAGGLARVGARSLGFAARSTASAARRFGPRIGRTALDFGRIGYYGSRLALVEARDRFLPLAARAGGGLARATARGAGRLALGLSPFEELVLGPIERHADTEDIKQSMEHVLRRGGVRLLRPELRAALIRAAVRIRRGGPEAEGVRLEILAQEVQRAGHDAEELLQNDSGFLMFQRRLAFDPDHRPQGFDPLDPFDRARRRLLLGR